MRTHLENIVGEAEKLKGLRVLCRFFPRRSEVVQRLLAQECEICGATDNIEVHHIRKLADIEQKGRKDRPEWMVKKSARKRKTLVVCRQCHEKIQYGRDDGQTLKRKNYWKAK